MRISRGREWTSITPLENQYSFSKDKKKFSNLKKHSKDLIKYIDKEWTMDCHDGRWNAVQYLDYDVSQMISEIYLPDKEAKSTLDYTLKKFLENNYVMGMRFGALESCRPSNIPRKIPYDLTRFRRCHELSVHNTIARGYVREARRLAKKTRALNSLRDTLPGCEIGEHEVSVPEHRRFARHDIEWRGMKVEFNVIGRAAARSERVNH